MSVRDFLRAGHLPTLLASLLHFETSFMIWVLMGGLGVLIAADLGLSPAEKGLVVGVPLLGGALWRVPIGLFSDRFGGKRVGTVTMLAVLAPLALAWRVAADVPGLLAVGVLLGIAGSSFAVALPLASRAYPARWQGTAMGVAAAGNSGTVLATLLAPRLGEALGWHNVFAAAIVPALLATAIFVIVARDSRPPASPIGLGAASLRVLREGDLWWFAMLYSTTFGGYAGLSAFLGLYFHDQFGLSAVAAGGLVAACAVAGSLARPFGGLLADRVGGMQVLLVVFAALPIALIAPVVGAPLWLTFSSLLVGTAGLGMGNGAVFQLVPRRFPDAVGFTTGVVGAAGGLGGFALPAMLGIQQQLTGSYSPGFLIYAAILVYLGMGVAATRGGLGLSWRVPSATPMPQHSTLDN